MASLCKNLRLARHGSNIIGQRLGAVRMFCSNRPLLKTRPHLQVKSQSPSEARILGPRAFHNVVPGTKDDGEEPEFVPKKRITPPDYLVQIDSFSNLYKYDIDYLEAGIFEANGYKWALRIYPHDHWLEENKILVELALADPSAVPENWTFEAHFSIFLKNQIEGYYYVVCDGEAHLGAYSTKWSGLMPNNILMDRRCGYPKNDTCVFGAEVIVTKTEVIEYLSLKNFKYPPYKQEFEIPNFPSSLDNGGWVSHQTWTSQIFFVGGREWMLKVCPKGWEDSVGHLSIFLEHYVISPDEENNYPWGDVKASITITLKSPFGPDYDVKKTCSDHFLGSGNDHSGWHSFIDLVTLNDPDNGFIKDGCVQLELQLSLEEVEE